MKPVVDCEVTFETVKLCKNALVFALTIAVPFPDGLYDYDLDEPTTKECSQCGYWYPGGEKKCPECAAKGWTEPNDERPF